MAVQNATVDVDNNNMVRKLRNLLPEHIPDHIILNLENLIPSKSVYIEERRLQKESYRPEVFLRGYLYPPLKFKESYSIIDFVENPEKYPDYIEKHDFNGDIMPVFIGMDYRKLSGGGTFTARPNRFVILI